MAIPVYVPQDKGVQDEGDDSESDLHHNIKIESCSVSDPPESGPAHVLIGFGSISEMRIRIQHKNEIKKSFSTMLLYLRNYILELITAYNKTKSKNSTIKV
jgi:hypothetical protein